MSGTNAETADEDTPQKRERLDPTSVQRRASDPAVSVWVTASAGTGKTKVLTDRVLRLMLQGTRPDQILCLTFTRAGASVMTNRIREELGLWATADAGTLEKRLRKLTGHAPTEDECLRARQMFGAFLDTPEGMRIQTIHSFAQSILKRFPIESGISPYFDIMDDQTAAALLRASQAEVLQSLRDDPAGTLAKAAQMVTPEVSEDDFLVLINELTYRRGQLLKIFEDFGGLDPAIDGIYEYLSVPKGMTSKKMNEALNSDRGLNGAAPDISALRSAAEILSQGTAAEKEKAAILKSWIDAPEKRVDMFWDYAGIFLTTEGEARKRLTTKQTAAAEDALRKEAERLIAGNEAIQTMNVARGTESLLRLTSAILYRYTDKKRAMNLLDFDDLVHLTNVMMQKDNMAGWVLQKLPGDIRHILVDEAQDTNPDQWQLVSHIVTEFFTNPARADRKDQTLFVVGDEKQSIFSFQRADPEEFNRRKKFFAGLVKKAGGKWRDVDMEIAFRSTAAITEAVDAVFAEEDASDGLFFKDAAADKRVRHSPYRRGQAGVVELHPLLRARPKEEMTPWAPPLAREEAEDLSRALAEQIADQIKGWIDQKEMLPSRARAMTPADILILVRRRSAFVDHMVRALKKRDIPVAGADRLSLRSQIVVMDLVALGETILFPGDDYKLASVLKCPLIGMTDQQLETLAARRKGTLWDALKDAAEKNEDRVYADALRYLGKLQELNGEERPYEFYSSVLMDACPTSAKSGLYAFYSRLGFEAEDPLVEFMNAAERYEKNHAPTLQGFLFWLDAGEAEVKRELSLSADNPRVHIMTVHGAKGLEAPVVILPDTTGIPEDNSKARPKFLWPEGERDVPLWVPKVDLESKAFKKEKEKVEKERDREFRRLLYVAMTRAADRLYVYGALGERYLPSKSWYALIKAGLEKNLAGKIETIPLEKDDAGEEDAAEKHVLRHTSPQTGRPEPDGMAQKHKLKLSGTPAWARHMPKQPLSLTERFLASDYRAANDEVSAPSPLSTKGKGEDVREIGTVVHRLLELLPQIPEKDQEALATKYLSKPAFGLSLERQVKLRGQVMDVLRHPEFGPLFGKKSKPEVSIVAAVERKGERKMMNAQIDRLVVSGDTVLIVDYKNFARIPPSPEKVDFKYIVQMAAYRLAVRQMYPRRKVECALLFTRNATLMPLPPEMLDQALEKIGLKPYHPPKPSAPKPPSA